MALYKLYYYYYYKITCKKVLYVNFCDFFQGTRQEQDKKLLTSSTLYVGNLSFYTTEEQIHELFNRAGDIKRIIMGLDKLRKTPCGFCFVEYPLWNHCFLLLLLLHCFLLLASGHKMLLITFFM